MHQFTSNILRKIKNRLSMPGKLLHKKKELNDMVLFLVWKERLRSAKNPLNKYGTKYFSQSDEDGITLEIINRIGLKNGVFAEFGVGDGSENNTLVLMANHWKGFWTGNEELFFRCDGFLRNFNYYQQWVTRENIVSLALNGLLYLKEQKVNVISLDLDGNDFYFAKDLLENQISPDLFIVEYNAKFPPPIDFVMDYDAHRAWDGSDYFGASLSSFVRLFAEHGYMLVCCNAFTGSNAFFVKKEHAKLFDDVPGDIDDIYQTAQYAVYETYGHKPSPRTIEKLLRDNEPD